MSAGCISARTPDYALLASRSLQSAGIPDRWARAWSPCPVQLTTPAWSLLQRKPPSSFDQCWKSSSLPVNSFGRPRPFTSMRLGVFPKLICRKTVHGTFCICKSSLITNLTSQCDYFPLTLCDNLLSRHRHSGVDDVSKQKQNLHQMRNQSFSRSSSDRRTAILPLRLLTKTPRKLDNRRVPAIRAGFLRLSTMSPQSELPSPTVHHHTTRDEPANVTLTERYATMMLEYLSWIQAECESVNADKNM